MYIHAVMRGAIQYSTVHWITYVVVTHSVTRTRTQTPITYVHTYICMYVCTYGLYVF